MSHILKDYDPSLNVGKVTERLAGNVKHLLTEMDFQLESDQLENLIHELHPTPAVCGLDKTLALEIIQEMEGYERNLYAGFIGPYQVGGSTSLFVNLRCAQLDDERITLFVGGGVTAESIPSSEWEETELKSQSIRFTSRLNFVRGRLYIWGQPMDDFHNLFKIFLAHGIYDVVISPGSRNAPLIKAFVEHENFNLHSIADERSAGFFALGRSLHSKRATILCCTSGSALLNYAPAVAEAFYQGVSLIILSADRPEDLIDQGEGQTIRQLGVYGWND